MEDPRTDQPIDDGENLRANEASKGQENDPEAIANRVVDVFWESLNAAREDDS